MALSKYFKVTQYQVGGYPKDQLEKVQTLFSQAFGGRTLSIETLHWQMEKNPCLKERATSLWQGETLVAYNALTPFWAILRGEEIVAAISGTSMGDENYPGTTVQIAMESDKKNKDIQMVIGFPNHNSFGITIRYLKDYYAGDIAFWTSKARKIDVPEIINEFFSFSEEYEVISRKLAQEHEFINIRKKDFLDWRFFQKPRIKYRAFEYEKRGYIVVDIYVDNGTRQLQVVDILVDSEEVMDVLLKYAINLSYKWDCEEVKLWLTSKRYTKVLKQNGFTYGNHPFAMTIRNQMLDIHNSYITMADSDVF